MAGKAKPIGISSLHVAKLKSDAAGTKPSYDTPVAIPGITQLELGVQSSFNKFYADDGIDEVLDAITGVTVGLQVGGLSMEELALLRAVETPTKGAALSDFGMLSDYIALGYRRLMTGLTPDGRQRYRYVWLYKVKLAPPGDTAQTKGESAQVQPESLSGECAPLAAYKPAHSYWKYTYDNWADDATSQQDADFFKTVVGLPEVSPG